MVKANCEVVSTQEDIYGTFQPGGRAPHRALAAQRFRYLAAVAGVCILCLAALSYRATSVTDGEEAAQLGGEQQMHEEELLRTQGRAVIRAIRTKAATKLSQRARAAMHQAVRNAPSVVHSDIGDDALRLEAIQALAHIEMEIHNPDMSNGDTMHLRQEAIRAKKRLAKFESKFNGDAAATNNVMDEISV